MQKLSAELFQEITRSLTSDRSLRIHEKRNKPRVGLRKSLDVISCESGQQRSSASVWIRDLSADGLGLVSTALLKEGVLFIAEFNRNGNSPLHIMYKVAHCRALGPGMFSVGAKLVNVMPATTTHKPPSARRTAHKLAKRAS